MLQNERHLGKVAGIGDEAHPPTDAASMLLPSCIKAMSSSWFGIRASLIKLLAQILLFKDNLGPISAQ